MAAAEVVEDMAVVEAVVAEVVVVEACNLPSAVPNRRAAVVEAMEVVAAGDVAAEEAAEDTEAVVEDMEEVVAAEVVVGDTEAAAEDADKAVAVDKFSSPLAVRSKRAAAVEDTEVVVAVDAAAAAVRKEWLEV